MNKRFNIDWDNELTQEQLINLILTDEDLPKLRSLTIGNWGDCWEDETCQPIIDMIVENAPRFSHLESLFIGDMESEDCEISWIKQGDYSRLYAALPNLKELIIKGASDLRLGAIHHEKLEHLEIISGGIPSNVLAELQNAQLPALKTLKLFLGVEEYGFDGSLDNVMALVSKDLFPQLNHLGLMNSEEQENLVEQWLPKASVKHKTYDLRIVCLDGEIIWRVVRTSSQPITNLHLQNQAYRFESLELSAAKVAEIDTLCQNAMRLFPGIRLAGIDVLLTTSLTPYIIEINGQGDLIYQDAQQNNLIYQAQIRAMRKQNV
ncbi:periplasmic protein [Salmonella enterica subsp. enterica serovar Typhi]|nr:periplasmic protein [Salmonella enterica subsp. enterica serovar Typhi]CHO70537.1 periplasmic protein [Salmonella enterica subsp. enterica serovar Typhi]CHS38488.1 periplasmic protein [Salmonella enterica subsp. enterica serovar Typhi]